MKRVLKPTVGNATAAVQNAINEVFLAGGGTVVLEKGVYPIGSVRLRSRVTLYLKSGAVISGSRDPKDYQILQEDALEPLPPDEFCSVGWSRATPERDNRFLLKCGSRWTNAMIRLAYAEDAAIVGEKGSLIEGNDPFDPDGEEHYRGPHGISFYHCAGLTFSGLTVQNTGNWAFCSYFSRDLTFRDLTVLGGHDGVHTSSADHVLIENCRFETGDDCVAGFNIFDMTVRNCDLNSACSAFRLGGTDVCIENCRAWGPANYGFRGSLSREEKERGAAADGGRKNMLAFFTYYSDFTLSVRHAPGNITVRDCTVSDTDRFLHFNFSGSERWQLNRALGSIRFENLRATGLGMSLCAYGDANDPLKLTMRNCELAFREPVPEAIRTANYATIDLENVCFRNVDGPLVRSWGGDGSLRAVNVGGAAIAAVAADTPFQTVPI